MWKNKLKIVITKSKLNRNTLAEKTDIPIPITYNILTCNMQSIYTSKAGSVWKQVLQNYPATTQRTGRKALHSDSRQSSTAYFPEKFYGIHAKWHPKSKNKKEENNKENNKEDNKEQQGTTRNNQLRGMGNRCKAVKKRRSLGVVLWRPSTAAFFVERKRALHLFPIPLSVRPTCLTCFLTYPTLSPIPKKSPYHFDNPPHLW